MKRVFIVIMASLLLLPLSASAAPTAYLQTTGLTFTGTLRRYDALYTGPCQARAALYDADAGGSELDSVDVGYINVIDGRYSLSADFGVAPFAYGPRLWVELQFRCVEDTDYIAEPRQELTPTPYALWAHSAGTAITATAAISAEMVPWSGLAGCDPGQLRKWDGSAWTCSADEGGVEGSTYTAGDGLDLVANEFSISPTYRLPQACALGQVTSWSGSVWNCADDVAGNVYSAGYGLVLTGTEFSVLSGTVQLRVASACAPGSAIDSIAIDGSVTCATVGTSVNPGTITSVVAGPGLSGGGITGTVTLTVASGYQLPQTCDIGQRPSWDGSAWSCADDALGGAGTITGVIASFGLTGGGSTGDVSLSVVTSTVQARVSGTCSVDQYITAIAADGSVSCGDSIQGPQGITGTQGIQGEIGPIGPMGITGTQGITGPQGSPTTVLAGSGLSGGGSGSTITLTVTSAPTATTAYSATTVPWAGVTGKPTIGTITGVTAGSGLSGGGASGVVTLTVTSAPTATQSITASVALTATATSWSGIVGKPTIGTVTGVTAGNGLSGGGTSGSVSLSIDPTYTQRRVGANCSIGQYMTSILQDGSITCDSVVDPRSPYLLAFTSYAILSPMSGTAYPFAASIHEAATITSWEQVLMVQTTNNASNYWTVYLLRLDTGGNVASFNTSSMTAGTYARIVNSGLSLSITTSMMGLYVKVIVGAGAPGPITMFGPAVWVQP
jgi:hypothetical protein